MATSTSRRRLASTTKLLKKQYTDSQLNRFLESAVAGVTGLDSVLATTRAARAAAGVKTDISFSEYVNALTNVAQTMDGANKTVNPRRQTVNMHDMIFEDDIVTTTLEVDVHDFLPEPEPSLEVNQANRAPTRRKVMMDKRTWQSLNAQDQKAWDTISEQWKEDYS